MAVQVIIENCTACQACVEVCPTEAITVEDHAIIDEAECTECGACVDECPSDALVLP
jgi:ferredoxin